MMKPVLAHLGDDPKGANEQPRNGSPNVQVTTGCIRMPRCPSSLATARGCEYLRDTTAACLISYLKSNNWVYVDSLA